MDIISRHSDSGLVLGNNLQRLDITTATLPITFGAAFMNQVGGSPAVFSVRDIFYCKGRRFYPAETRSARRLQTTERVFHRLGELNPIYRGKM